MNEWELYLIISAIMALLGVAFADRRKDDVDAILCRYHTKQDIAEELHGKSVLSCAAIFALLPWLIAAVIEIAERL